MPGPEGHRSRSGTNQGGGGGGKKFLYYAAFVASSAAAMEMAQRSLDTMLAAGAGSVVRRSVVVMVRGAGVRVHPDLHLPPKVSFFNLQVEPNSLDSRTSQKSREYGDWSVSRNSF